MNYTKFGRAAGGDDNSRGGAVGDEGTHEDGVATVGDGDGVARGGFGDDVH